MQMAMANQRPMFIVDMKNYDGSETLIYKTACRGIIWKDGKLALVRSQVHGYYKFPGGGRKKGETNIDALVREVREEAGLDVIPSTAKLFGMAKRREKVDADHTLVQESYYYDCKVTGEMHPPQLTKKEALAGFVFEFTDPQTAIEANDRFLSKNSYGAITRDNRVLRMIAKRAGQFPKV